MMDPKTTRSPSEIEADLASAELAEDTLLRAVRSGNLRPNMAWRVRKGWVIKLPGGTLADWTFAPRRNEAVEKAKVNLPPGGWRRALGEGCKAVHAVKNADGIVVEAGHVL